MTMWPWATAVALSATAVFAFPSADPLAFGVLERRGSSLEDCLKNRQVAFSDSSSANFSALSKPYNLRLQYKPTAIALPTTAQQVSDAVVCAAAAGVKVQPKCGGHSYASYSLGGQDGSFVIDLENLQSITVDQNTQIAQVGGGVRLGNLALALYNNGHRAVSHGTCPGVGIGGHFTHGGSGLASRRWGLALDSIVGLDVVLANGTQVYASDESYPDIFYVMRGAAESFGIVTTFHLQTQAAPDSVVDFAINFEGALNSADAAAAAFLHIQKVAQDASIVDRDLAFRIYLDPNQYRVYGFYYNGEDNFRNKIYPALTRGLPVSTKTPPSIRTLGWLDALLDLSNEKTLQTPFTGYNEHDNFYAKSVVTQEAEPLTQAAVKSYFDYLLSNGRNTQFGWFSIIDLYGGPDSQINVHSVDSSAYSHRSSLFVMQHYARTYNSLPGSADVTDAMIGYISNLVHALESPQSNGDFAAYANYVDPLLDATTAHQLYYGPETYQKLLNIKNQVDPQRLFWNPQTIGS
ncbi:MAG: hypothetical protein M1838_001578 [Thelocarpon superellum]|nr:MAG: hypothetical protein M1838_001578 [Thelocarpon superellum]